MKKVGLFFVLISLVSCKEIATNVIKATVESNSSESLSDDNFKRVKIDDLYSLSLPKHMKELNNINEEAILQYGNIYKELYSIVIVENTQNFVDVYKEYGEYDEELPVIENYKEVQLKLFSEAMKIDKTNEYGLMEIEGFPARQFNIQANVEGINAYYLVTFVEGKDSIYMIMSWTLLNRLKKYSNLLEIINGSFELNTDETFSNEVQ